MPTVVGGLAALLALATGILSEVDPIDCLWRAAAAFAIGMVATQIWYVFFATRTGASAYLAEDNDSGPNGA